MGKWIAAILGACAACCAAPFLVGTAATGASLAGWAEWGETGLIVAVVALSGFVVHRLHGVFGIHKGSFGGGTSGEVLDQFNAKTITLEVWGSPGSTATINYLDENSHPQQALNVPLPWNTVLKSTKPGIPANLVAQGDGSWIACRFVVNNHDGRGDVIKAPNHSPPNQTVNAFVYCLDKSA